MPFINSNSKNGAITWPHLGCGVGMRREHVDDIFSTDHKLEWFEVITENFLDTEGLPRRNIERLREHFPVVLHGVSLSIASTDPIDFEYLKKVKQLIKNIQPAMVSDHLCWTGVDHQNLHQLLPLPRTEEVIKHIVNRIKVVQDFLGQRMIFENISTYLDFSNSAFPEWEFLAGIANESDSGILFDVNNLFINAYNHGYHALDFIKGIPSERVGQYHLAGHMDHGTYLFDAHSTPVSDDVWKLFETCLHHIGTRPTLIEWDEDIPPFETLIQEAQKAESIRTRYQNQITNEPQNEFKGSTATI